MVNKFLKILLLTTTITPLLAFNYVSRDKQNIQHQYLLNFEANGGSEVSPLIYINEDTTFKMPTTKNMVILLVDGTLITILLKNHFMLDLLLSMKILLYMLNGF